MRLQGCGYVLVRAGGAGGARPVRAFTLIEILFAVMVLGIALLGLGAFFPTVVRQQQVAQDETLGVVASQSAEATLRGTVLGDTPSLQESMAEWARLTQAQINGRRLPFDLPAIPNDGSWVMPLDQITGALPLGAQGYSIPLSDRLYPSDSAGLAAPQFVWDVAVRRLTPRVGPPAADAPGSDSVQVAVFVRRVDPRLSAPRVGNALASIYQAIQDANLPTASRRWPVSALRTGPFAGVEPTLDGRADATAEYSAPVTVDVNFPPALGGVDTSTRDRVQLVVRDARDKRLFQLLSQVGQQFVDNLGNVYTVAGADTDPRAASAYVVRFSPPVPESVGATDRRDASQFPSAGTTLRSIVMTPQVPASVLVFTCKP